MATSIKLSDGYWDPTSIGVSTYKADGSTFNNCHSLSREFKFIDCGGFQNSGSYSTPPYFESIRGNTFSTMGVKFAITFSAAPVVIACPVGSDATAGPTAGTAIARSGGFSVASTSTTGFTYYTANKDTAYDWVCGMN